MSTVALDTYRDDGPLVTALGRLRGRAAGVHPLGVYLVAVAPVAVLATVSADRPGTLPLGAALGWYVLLAGLAAGTSAGRTLAWVVPPVVRGAEYLLLVRMAMWAQDDAALPAAFALLSALSFHHYDIVYRLRHQRVAPAAWVGPLAGGWELRLLGAFAALLAGALTPVYAVAAAVLAVVFLGESITGWVRFSSSQRRATALESEDEEEAE